MAPVLDECALTDAPSPQAGMSLHVPVSQGTRSAPGSGEVVSTEAEIQDAITITSDPAQSLAEDNIQNGEHPEEPDTNRVVVATEPMDGTTLNETTVHEESPAGSEYDSTPEVSPSPPQHSPAPAPETFVGENEAAEEAITPATPSAASGSLNAPRTPKKRHPTPVLASPAGVGKANFRARNKSSGTKHAHMTLESTLPSEEDLLYVLMHRCRERGEATQRSMTKIKTLEHRNFKLHKKAQEIYQERDNAIAAQTEASEKYSSLKASLEGFKSKYSKLKNFARTTHKDLLLLRQAADMQRASFQDLKQLGDHVRSSLRDAGSSVRIVQTSLDKQKQGLATIRSEADRIVSESTQAAANLSAGSGRITELMKEKNRLEEHVVSLENAQQRATQAARDSNRDVSTALVKVTQRLDGIEFAALQHPQPSNAAEQCLVLLQTLHQGKEPAAREFQELAKSVAALQDTVLEGVQSIGRDYRSLQTMKRGQDLGMVVEQLKRYVEGLQFSVLQVQQSNEERVALEARLEGAQEMIKELQKSVARVDSYAATFQMGMETISNTSNAHRERQTQLQSQIDQYQIRYTSRCSELATVKQELTDKCQAMEKEVDRLQALLSCETSKREDIEEKLRSAQSEYVHVNNQALRDQVCRDQSPSMNH